MSWDGQERRQAQLEIRELLREETRLTVQPLVERSTHLEKRVEHLEKAAEKWDTAICVLRWAAALTVAAVGVVAQFIDWVREYAACVER